MVMRRGIQPMVTRAANGPVRWSSPKGNSPGGGEFSFGGELDNVRVRAPRRPRPTCLRSRQALPPLLLRNSFNDFGYANGFSYGRMFIFGLSKKF
jgi:hypothetical protein